MDLLLVRQGFKTAATLVLAASLILGCLGLGCKPPSEGDKGKSLPPARGAAEAAGEEAAPTSPQGITPIPELAAKSPRHTPTTIPPATPPPSGMASSTPAPAGGRPSISSGATDAAGRVIPVATPIMPRGPRRPPPTRLIIPSIGLDARIISLGTHTSDKGELMWDTAPFAVGHHITTPHPGEPGNVVLSGHISSPREGAVLKRLPEVKVGDGIVVATKDQYYLYQVVSTATVEPTQVEVMQSGAEEVLTIITCVPDGIYSHRLVVRAKRI